jgi:predicted  nucleic acid-binding Zn-ribbon protein
MAEELKKDIEYLKTLRDALKAEAKRLQLRASRINKIIEDLEARVEEESGEFLEEEEELEETF